MATAPPVPPCPRAWRRRVAQETAGQRDGHGAGRPPRVVSDLLMNVHCGSKMMDYTRMRWSHAFFQWMTRKLDSPDAPGFRSAKRAVAGEQIRHHDPPMFHLTVSRNPGERIVIKHAEGYALLVDIPGSPPPRPYLSTCPAKRSTQVPASKRALFSW